MFEKLCNDQYAQPADNLLNFHYTHHILKCVIKFLWNSHVIPPGNDFIFVTGDFEPLACFFHANNCDVRQSDLVRRSKNFGHLYTSKTNLNTVLLITYFKNYITKRQNELQQFEGWRDARHGMHKQNTTIEWLGRRLSVMSISYIDESTSNIDSSLSKNIANPSIRMLRSGNTGNSQLTFHGQVS